jgi:hypothetical protein
MGEQIRPTPVFEPSRVAEPRWVKPFIQLIMDAHHRRIMNLALLLLPAIETRSGQEVIHN